MDIGTVVATLYWMSWTYISSSFEFITWKIANKTLWSLLCFYVTLIGGAGKERKKFIQTKLLIEIVYYIINWLAYPFLSEFSKSVHNYAKHDVQTDCGDDDEEGYIKYQSHWLHLYLVFCATQQNQLQIEYNHTLKLSLSNQNWLSNY